MRGRSSWTALGCVCYVAIVLCVFDCVRSVDVEITRNIVQFDLMAFSHFLLAGLHATI